MTARRVLSFGAMTIALAAIAWALFVGLPRSSRPRAQPPPPPAAAAAAPGRKIKARLFYVSEDGTRLTGVERDIAYGDGPAAQAQ